MLLRLSSVLLLAAVLAACSAPAMPTMVPSGNGNSVTHRPHAAPEFSVLYSFQGGGDGAYPVGTLAAFGGMIYGTTQRGGLCAGSCGYGAAFAIDAASGYEQSLYDFPTSSYSPSYNGLTAYAGSLYGTTAQPGSSIFQIDPLDYYESNVARFSDNVMPSNVLGLANEYYGTTSAGGPRGLGTVYVATPGNARTLYYFQGGRDGANPTGALVQGFHGELYGATSAGGAYGRGTVFEVNPEGSKRTLYSFKGRTDAATPQGPLLFSNGELYGTSAAGGQIVGTHACVRNSSKQCGAVFEVDVANGRERVIYRFEGEADGAFPSPGLAMFDGLLYGTSSGAGPIAPNVFRVNPKTSVENVVHRFKLPASLGWAVNPLHVYSGVIYGSTFYGGTSTYCPNGCGTVYEIIP